MSVRHFWVGLLLTWLLMDFGSAAWMSAQSPGDESPLRRHVTRLLEFESDPDVVFYGNSMASMALQPDLIRQSSGRRVYNHAVYVGGLSIPLWSLHQLERQDRLPKAVVVAISPFEFSAKPDTLRIQIDRHLEPADISWIATSGPAAPQLVKAWLTTSLSRAHRDRHQWQDTLFSNGLMDPWAFGPAGGDLLPEDDPVVLVDSWFKTRAFYHRTLSNDFRAESLAAPFAVLARLAADCQRLGVSLTVLSLPESSRYPECYGPGDYDWFWQKFENFLDANEISWIDDRRRFDDLKFRDGVHLIPSACRTYSNEMGRRLQDVLER